MFKLTTEDQRSLRAVLAVSWLSGLVIILAGIVITGGAIITFSLNNSTFKQDLLGWEQSHTNTSLSATGQSLQPVSPTLANSWPLILVWAVVGLGVYTIAASIVRVISETLEFRRELDYVHANPRSMLESIIEHLALRIVAAVLLVSLVVLFVYHTFPYVIGACRTSAAHLGSFQAVHYAGISFLLVALCTYAGSVLLRLSAGKQRLFSRD